MIELKDQMNNTIRLGNTPKRIISLVPSQTEFLYDIGLNTEVVGITKFCIHPNQWFKSKTRVGGTKTIDLDKIKVLNPDLIIANKEENTQAEIETLQKLYNVYVSDIYTLNDSYQMMNDIGLMTGKTKKTIEIINSIQTNFKDLKQVNKRVLYLIWREPFMIAGQDTFINHLLKKCGLNNAIEEKTSRYNEISKKQISLLNLDYVLLSSEPYPFKEKHIAELEKITSAKIVLVDGEMFSWYGSRLTNFVKYYTTKLLKELT
jgi:ABC-type Fe3+-hydroxamate transport system substrate-binding protein